MFLTMKAEEFTIWLDVCKMSKYLRYLKAQLKRTSKAYPIILVFTCVITVCVLVLLSTMFVSDADSVNTTRIKIGMVGDTSESYLDIGISAVQQLDSSKYYVEFVNVEQEEQAQQLLKKGDLFGYILIPDGFVESIVVGENKHLTYVSNNSPATIGPLLINEIIKLVSDMLVESQSGIYAFIDVAEGEDVRLEGEALDKAVERLNLKYIGSTLDRESYYKIEFIGIGSGLSFANYYYNAFFILLMMLWGMTCIHLRVKSDMSTARFVRSRGIGAFGQTLCDYIPFAMIIYISAAVLTVCIGLFGKNIGLSVFENSSGAGDYILYVLSLIPAVAVITVLQFMLYELSTNVISGVLLQLVSTICLSYASGFFYPLSSFPISVQNVAKYLPTRVAFSYSAEVFTNDNSTSSLVMCIVYFVLLLLISTAIRAYKMRSSRL